MSFVHNSLDSCCLYNNDFRSLMTVSRDASISFAMVSNATDTFNVLVRKHVNSINKRIKASQNIFINTITSSLFYIYSILTVWASIDHTEVYMVYLK